MATEDDGSESTSESDSEEISLAAKRTKHNMSWYLDSGCLRDMTGKRSMFQDLMLKSAGEVKFGGDQKGEIIGSGTISTGNSPSISNLLLVEGLAHNLLPISQLSDNGYDIIFNQKSCKVVSQKDGSILFTGKRKNNIYKTDLQDLMSQKVTCLMSVSEEQWVWHRRLGHASLRKISQINKLNLVRGLPNLKFKSDALCEACQKGKFSKPAFKSKNVVSTSRPLELLHIDLFGPVKTASVRGKKYGLVIVDDYSRWTWVKFLKHKDETHSVFFDFCIQIQSEKECKIIKVRSDHGGEFENGSFEEFFKENGIAHDFSCPRTPQQNGVVERKNRTLQEMARTMINETNMAKHFWAEAINTACYIQNRISIRPILNKTPYELWKNKKPNISYFHPFGCICFILNTKDHLGKFDSKAQKCLLLGYSERSKGYRVYNTETLIVEESINIRFDDKLGSEKPKQVDNFAGYDIDISEAVEPRSNASEAELLRSKESEDQVSASLDCKEAKTPMHPTCILGKDEVSKKVDQKLYRGMIGSLLYLTASRPDILFCVCLCARFQSDPRESHLTAVKRILRYLKGTTNVGLVYRKSKEYNLVGFCDADYAGDRIERKSTSGSCQFLGSHLISWYSKKQATIALSTTEAEYVAAAGCSTQMLWMKSQLEDYQIYESNIPIFCDNTSAICLSKNPILHSKAKLIEIKHHFIRDYVQKGVISLNFVDTDHQWADIFTKPLAEDRFKFILKNISMDLCPE